jgi:hypothetical protein
MTFYCDTNTLDSPAISSMILNLGQSYFPIEVNERPSVSRMLPRSDRLTDLRCLFQMKAFFHSFAFACDSTPDENIMFDEDLAAKVDAYIENCQKYCVVIPLRR